MSQASPPQPTPVHDVINYRPISVMALLGLGLSLVYSLFVVLFALLAFMSRDAFILESWHYVFPVTAIVVSWLAVRQIRNSEGTLAGETLAKWGIWVSVLTGFGYGAYHLATTLAIRQQSYSFLMVQDSSGRSSGFLSLLKDDKVAHAFLLTMPNSSRTAYNPDNPSSWLTKVEIPSGDVHKGAYTEFADAELVYVAKQVGEEEGSIESLGVQNWEYKNGSYRIEQSFRIPTKEIVLDIIIPVRSADSSNQQGVGRTWHVLWNEVKQMPTTQLTPLGQAVHTYRFACYRVLSNWSEITDLKPYFGGLAEVKDLTDWSAVYFPANIPETQEAIRKEAESFLRGKSSVPHPITILRPRLAPWKKLRDGRLQLEQSFVFPAVKDSSGKWKLSVEGRFWITYLKPPGDFSSVDNISENPADWEISSYEILFVRDMPERFQERGRIQSMGP
jgi:hypothetical protein